ncbi:MAG: type II toxin-antitoxin system RelE/ParE family toxin [Deltaproteobacteria bacterium]|nr:type II toxin-antitoxin system RelE/ParE family toxin [Deltaproteobacteria bacterium]
MSYRVELESQARREFLSLEQVIQERIADVLDDLAVTPRPSGCKKLTNQEGYRARKGDYRILYTIDDTHRIVRIYRIAHRREVYR